MSFSSFSSFASAHSAGKKSSAFAGVDYVTDSLLLHYDSNNYTSGVTISDETDNGNDGTISGSPTYSSPIFQFDGTNDYIRTPDLDGDITTEAESHSVEIWFKTSVESAGNLLQYAGQTTPDTSYHHSAIEIYRGTPIFSLWNGTGLTNTQGDDTLNDDTWHQIVLTYDGTNLRGYTDGLIDGAATAIAWDSPMNDGAGAFHIFLGAESATSPQVGGYFTGSIGIMRVYNKALSGEEIVQNFSASVDIFS